MSHQQAGSFASEYAAVLSYVGKVLKASFKLILHHCLPFGLLWIAGTSMAAASMPVASSGQRGLALQVFSPVRQDIGG